MRYVCILCNTFVIDKIFYRHLNSLIIDLFQKFFIYIGQGCVRCRVRFPGSERTDGVAAALQLSCARNSRHDLVRVGVFLFVMFIQTAVQAQVFPGEHSKLHYRIIGFTFPVIEHCNSYKLEIAFGEISDNAIFNNNVLITAVLDTCRKIIEVPEFGRDYTWRVSWTDVKKVVRQSTLHHFSTGLTDRVDTSCNRLRVVNNTGKFDSSYLFLDQSKLLYDMSGRPVWYLPDIDSVIDEKCLPRDMKLTSRGTITFIASSRLYEITYDGKVLWTKANSAGQHQNKMDHFHHEFTRLTNGHYMVMGIEENGRVPVLGAMAPKAAPDAGPGRRDIKSAPHPGAYARAPFGQLVEFDEKGNTVWTWNTSRYIANEGADLTNNRLPDGSTNTDFHDNAFYFDEESSTIYISYKNLNRIVKISYPGGKVLAEYGEKFLPDVTGQATKGLFCGQHAVRRSPKGYLYLFNNNSCNPDGLPRVQIMREPEGTETGLQLVWVYECKSEGTGQEDNRSNRSLAGGSVEELEDGAILVCTGTPSARVFVVNRNKHILWSAFPETWMPGINKWQLMALYRTSIIKDKNELQRLIWRSQE